MANNMNIRRQTKALVTIDSPSAQVISNPWKSSICVSNVTKASAFVDDLEDQLVNIIATHCKQNLVVCCIAWLSNPRIIAALTRHAKAVLSLVNDEDYSVWGGGKCMELYAQLPAIKEPLSTLFDHMETPLRGINDSNYSPVRCIRNVGDALMHSKYLVFFRSVALERQNERGHTEIVWRDVPYAVWTGSMNYTKKASRNQENAVFLESELLARFYFNDFVNSFLRSAPLRLTGGGGSGGNVNDDKPIGYIPPNNLSHIPLAFRSKVKASIKPKRTKPHYVTRMPKNVLKKKSAGGGPRARKPIKKNI